MTKIDALVLSCEHGGNRVPAAQRHLFARHGRLLSTHRAFDPGALDLARYMARHTDAPLFASTTTRLLVDLNRSSSNPRVFSVVTRPLDRVSRQRLLRDHHAPHWASIEAALRRHVHAGHNVLHLAVHTFTPVLSGVRRTCDVGILYDPRRVAERRFSRTWLSNMRDAAPKLRVRRNYPYRGSDDGLTTAMRKRFAARRYLGIELEINQERWAKNDARRWSTLRRVIVDTLDTTLHGR